LVGDEGVEIVVGETHGLPLAPAPDVHVAQRTGCDVCLERLDRTAELRRRLLRVA
jgi:hypothetical protein